MSLLYIGQQITIYSGFFLVVTGLIGNVMNIFIFSSVRTFRQTPSTFYFLIESINNIGYIAITLIPRIVSVGFGIDLTQTSTSWCKIRQFFTITLNLIAFTFPCLAIIDQFFATSRSARLRRLTNIKWAHRIAIITIVIWSIHGITPLVFYDISPIRKTCVSVNAGFSIYFRIHLLSFICAIPISIMVVFGCLVYRNIHQTEALARQGADRQITKMVLIKVLLIVLTITPFGFYNTYNLITSNVLKDADRIMNESFAGTTIVSATYIYFAGSCYMFLISSSRFRREVRERIFRWPKRNQINPSQQPTLQRQALEGRTNN